MQLCLSLTTRGYCDHAALRSSCPGCSMACPGCMAWHWGTRQRPEGTAGLWQPPPSSSACRAALPFPTLQHLPIARTSQPKLFWQWNKCSPRSMGTYPALWSGATWLTAIVINWCAQYPKGRPSDSPTLLHRHFSRAAALNYRDLSAWGAQLEYSRDALI